MVNTRVASQAKVLQRLRAPNTIVWCGHSLASAQFLDSPTNNNLSNAGWMNWTAGALRAQGKPWITLANFGVAGTRTDQWGTQIANAIALNPAMISLNDIINDIAGSTGTYVGTAGSGIAGQTVNATNVPALGLASLKFWIKQINDAGIMVLYQWLRGGGSMTATQIGNMNDFNRLMADYLQFGDDFRGPPNVQVIDTTPYQVTTSSIGTVVLKNSQDGVHDNIAGARTIGLNANIISQIGALLLPFPNHRLSSLNQQNPSVGNYNLMAGAAGFTSSTAAPAGTGNTGLIPGNCTAGQTALATAAFSVNSTSADADGNTWGKEVAIAVTATGAGSVAFYIALNRTPIVVNDIIRGGWEIDVAASATGLGGVQTKLETFATGGPSPTFDMISSGLSVDTGNYTKYAAEPPPLKMGNWTGTAFTNLRMDIVMSGAGSCTVTVRKPWAERATA